MGEIIHCLTGFAEGSFVCPDPLYIVIDTTECYIPTLLINTFCKICLELQDSRRLLSRESTLFLVKTAECLALGYVF